MAGAPESRGFAATLANYSEASRMQDVGVSAAQIAADALPLSEWSEDRRFTIPLTPQTVALNWRSNVADTAHALREALSDEAQESKPLRTYVVDVENAARALLAAIGEAE